MKNYICEFHTALKPVTLLVSSLLCADVLLRNYTLNVLCCTC